MTTNFTLTTTSGRQAVISVPAGCDRWFITVRYVNRNCPSSDFLADVQPATPQEVVAFQAEYPTAHLQSLSRDC